MTRIDANLLIPGIGEPIKNATLTFEGGQITYAGPRLDQPDSDAVRADTVMPGLWDCHTHLMGVKSLNFELLPHENAVLRAARSVADLGRAVDAGVTSIREVGGLGALLAPAQVEGTIRAPHIYAAGALLSTTGGHGDLHTLPIRWVEEFGDVGYQRLADGPDDCAKATREQIRKGAMVIKICASGGVMSMLDDPNEQQFTLDEMRTIVEVAAMSGRQVAAHCHGKKAMLAAIEAGVHTIEHGTYVDEEVAAAMAAAGTILVPTRTIIDELLHLGDAPDYADRKLREIADHHKDAIGIAYRQGVKIAAGSDIGLSGADLADGWGKNGMEVGLLVDCGMSPLDAIQAATANAPATVGHLAPQSGQLADGFVADVITVAGNPLDDPHLLADPANVTAVWVDGAQAK